MPTVAVYNTRKEQVGEIELKDEIFSVPVRPHLLHEVVTMQLARRRAGTVATRGRSEVRGSGRKPWRQKGTGRARVGTRTSPLWRGGGIIFGPKPREYWPKVSKKIRKQALTMALSSKFGDNEMVVLDELVLPAIKTKGFVEVLKDLGTDNALVVIPERDETVERSARNVPSAKVLRAEGLNVYDILRHRQLILTKGAISKIETALLSRGL